MRAEAARAEQATSTYLTPPADTDTVGEILFLDFSVILLGAGLWRAELGTRATQLQVCAFLLLDSHSLTELRSYPPTTELASTSAPTGALVYCRSVRSLNRAH